MDKGHKQIVYKEGNKNGTYIFFKMISFTPESKFKL